MNIINLLIVFVIVILGIAVVVNVIQMFQIRNRTLAKLDNALSKQIQLSSSENWTIEQQIEAIRNGALATEVFVHYLLSEPDSTNIPFNGSNQEIGSIMSGVRWLIHDQLIQPMKDVTSEDPNRVMGASQIIGQLIKDQSPTLIEVFKPSIAEAKLKWNTESRVRQYLDELISIDD